MPYKVTKVDNTHCVVKQDTGAPVKGGCHTSRKDAINHLQALYASEAMAAVAESFSEDDIINVADVEFAIAEAPVDTTSPWEGEIAFEGQSTGDNRSFASDSISWNDLPVPLLWQKTSQDGHSGSWVIGRVDEIEKKDGTVFARGVLLDTPEATEYKSLLQAGAAGGVSIDGDSAQYSVEELENKQHRITFNSIRIRALTAVAIPAFASAKIYLVEDAPAETEFCDDGTPIEGGFKKRKKKNMVNWTYGNEAGLTAGALVTPPSRWFATPSLPGPTPLTVLEDGQVFGHIALWGTCHIGMPKCTAPPKGGTYAYFHTGALCTQEGEDVSVGHLTFNTGHAGIYDTPVNAAAHYDHTGTVAADVVAGEDKYGIWVAGAMRPHLSEEEVRIFKAAPISGDWRKIGARLELVAALSVNTPGFPVPRARALVAGGQDEAFISLAKQEDFETFGREAYKDDLVSRVNLNLEDLDLPPVLCACAGHEDMQLRVTIDNTTVTPSPEVYNAYNGIVQAANDAFFTGDISVKVELSTGALLETGNTEFSIDQDGLSQTPPEAIKNAVDAFIAIAKLSYGETFELEIDIDIKTPEIEETVAEEPVEVEAPMFTRYSMEQLESFVDENGNLTEFYNQCHDDSGHFCEGPDGPGRIRDNTKKSETTTGKKAPQWMKDILSRKRGAAVKEGDKLLPKDSPQYMKDMMKRKMEDSVIHPKTSSSSSSEKASVAKQNAADDKSFVKEEAKQHELYWKNRDAADAAKKKEFKSESSGQHPASDYAYVPEGDKSSGWKLRLTDKPGGEPSAKIVGAAVAALGKGFRGHKVEIPAADRPKVIAKVRAAWLKANPDKTRADLPDILKAKKG